MIALVAGTGALPGEIATRLIAEGTPPLVCELEGFAPDVPTDLPRLAFRLETLGTFIVRLRQMGVDRLCMAGAIRRPEIDPSRIDAATRPLVPRISAALGQGDDGALRAVIAIVEESGLSVVAAHEIVPHLLPPPGIPTTEVPDPAARRAASLGQETIAAMGARDQGQACVVRDGTVLAQEGPEGTDAMLRDLMPSADALQPDPITWALDAADDWLTGTSQSPARGAILFKAPKPGQDRRADLPVIGPGTAAAAAVLGLAGIVIEAGGVMVLDRDEVIRRLDEAGLFLWVRERDEP